MSRPFGRKYLRSPSGGATPSINTYIAGKGVLLFLADGFEECEGLIVVDILRRAGISVTTASIMGREQVVSSHQIKIAADVLAEQVDPAQFDAVVLPGGIPGTPNLKACPLVTDTCRSFFKSGKLVAAICAAPSILGALGLLQGKRATVYPGMEDTLAGAEHAPGEVVVDGNLITSRSMGTAIPFALTIAAYLLEDPAAAEQLADSICYGHYETY